MKSSTFKFTVLVSALLVGMCIFLLPSALHLYRIDYDADVGPGLVPMICLAGIACLTVYTLILDILQKRRAEAAAKRELEDGELDSSFLGTAILAIVLMSLYAAIWAHTNFIIASLLFCAAMGYLCLPKEERNIRKCCIILFFLAIFVLLVWAGFTKLLGVNLA